MSSVFLDKVPGPGHDAEPSHFISPAMHQICTLLGSRPLALAVVAFTLLSAFNASAQTSRATEASRAAEKTAKDIRAVTGGRGAGAKLPEGDPCTIVSAADVQKIFPGAKAERSKRLEDDGITECNWNGPDKQLVLHVQESYNSGTSARQDVLVIAGAITGFQAQKNVRIESLPGVGADAAALVETADKARGILEDAAYMSLRLGKHNVTIGSAELPRKDRAAALKVLADLGRVAEKRL